MHKNLFYLLGIGLIGTFAAGIILIGWTSWMTWVDLGLGLISLAVGAAIASGERPAGAAGWFAVICLALFGTWIAGLIVTGAVAWLLWTTLAFAAVYFVVAIASSGRRVTGQTRQIGEQPPRQGPRKAA